MADHIDFIFRADRENPPAERSLPWEETRDGITVVVEPKPHWADNLRAFRLDARPVRRARPILWPYRYLWR
ncbi:hypothetical protein [Brucella pseudogrignonensis]|uniref:hypothetical protein n=1 Tax=Brucella pseudogrignonensis TaxID=419475 RepID=UPI003D99056E